MAEIEEGKLSDFKPQEDNANQHTERGLRALSKAMGEVGYVAPMTAAANGEVIDGSARLEQSFDQFEDEAIVVHHDGRRPIVMVRDDVESADDPMAKQISWGANRIGQLDLKWSPAQMAKDLAAGVDLSALFSEKELEIELAELAGGDEGGDGADAKMDLADELQERWGVELGDVWECGEHRVICGDSTDRGVVSRLMGDDKADCLIADPPYGMNLETNYRRGGTEIGYNGVSDKNRGNYSPVIGDDKIFNPTQIFKIVDVKEQFWFGADYYAENIKDRNKGSWLVWDKRTGIEDIQFSLSEFELIWSKSRHLRTILRVKWFGIQGMEKQDTKQRVHPTQKPLELIEKIIALCNNANLILDPFLGSGTTLIACQKLNRRCYGIELDPSYVAVTLQRYLDSTGTTPTKQETQNV